MNRRDVIKTIAAGLAGTPLAIHSLPNGEYRDNGYKLEVWLGNTNERVYLNIDKKDDEATAVDGTVVKSRLREDGSLIILSIPYYIVEISKEQLAYMRYNSQPGMLQVLLVEDQLYY